MVTILLAATVSVGALFLEGSFLASTTDAPSSSIGPVDPGARGSNRGRVV